jgi:hypothetical protein
VAGQTATARDRGPLRTRPPRAGDSGEPTLSPRSAAPLRSVPSRPPRCTSRLRDAGLPPVRLHSASSPPHLTSRGLSPRAPRYVRSGHGAASRIPLRSRPPIPSHGSASHGGLVLAMPVSWPRFDDRGPLECECPQHHEIAGNDNKGVSNWATSLLPYASRCSILWFPIYCESSMSTARDNM